MTTEALRRSPPGCAALLWNCQNASREAGARSESDLNSKLTTLDAFLAGVEARALGIARYATRDPEAALDLVQDSMMRLAERYAGRPPDEWAPLFFRILQRRIRDWHRRRVVRERWVSLWGDRGVPGSAEPDHEDRRTPTPSRQTQQDASMAALKDALDALPARQQQVFLLRAWEGLDVKETAFAMGCSEGTVKTHYSRALAKLREALSEHRP